jgi:DNA-binding HxlR family transcriptional regulator
MNAPCSGCPINLTLEALGDRWSLIVIRDLMFGKRRQFREVVPTSQPYPQASLSCRTGLVSFRNLFLAWGRCW